MLELLLQHSNVLFNPILLGLKDLGIRQQVTSGHATEAYLRRYVTISYLSWLTKNEADRTADISQALHCNLHHTIAYLSRT